MTSVYSFCSSPLVTELKSVGQPSTSSSFAIYSPHSYSHQSYLETETVDDDDNYSFFVYFPSHLSDSILSNLDDQRSDIANSPSDAEKQIIQICSSSHGIQAKASQTHVLYLNPLLAVLFQRNLASKKKKKKKICPFRDSNSGLSIVSSMPCQPGHYSTLK